MDAGRGRRQVELTRTECLELLAAVPVGRVVFTLRALPAIRPVNHILEDGAIIIRSHLGSALASAVRPVARPVVLYEADVVDLADRLGWSVVVTGVAEVVTEPTQVARYERLLRSWVDQDMDCVIRIRPELVTGYRLEEILDGRPESAEPGEPAEPVR